MKSSYMPYNFIIFKIKSAGWIILSALLRCLAGFKRTGFSLDTHGSTAIEFSIVASPFLVLILANLELGTLYFASQALESFTESNARQIMVGLVQNQNFTAAQYKAQLCTQLPSLFSCSRFYVDVVAVNSFSVANLTLPTLTFDANGNVTNTWNFQPGDPGDIIVVRMLYAWPVANLPFGLTLVNQTNGVDLLMATSVFKNEAFQ